MRNVKTGKTGDRNRGRVSLERAISKLGLASRTEARSLVESGQVKVHGSVEKNPLRMVNPESAHIEIAGNKARKSDPVLISFHKPRNCLTTKRDPEGRKTIYDFLPEEFQHLHAVGRLDQFTSGLLLLTNDTKLSHFLTDPESGIERIYIAEVKGEFSDASRERALAGIEDEGEILIASRIEIQKKNPKESRLEIILTQGKNREIRRLCKALGHEVKSLIRIQYGPFKLEQLKPGSCRKEDAIRIKR